MNEKGSVLLITILIASVISLGLVTMYESQKSNGEIAETGLILLDNEKDNFQYSALPDEETELPILEDSEEKIFSKQPSNKKESNNVATQEQNLEILLKDDSKEISIKETESGLIESLKNYGVEPAKLQKVSIDIKQDSGWKFLETQLSQILSL